MTSLYHYKCPHCDAVFLDTHGGVLACPNPHCGADVEECDMIEIPDDVLTQLDKARRYDADTHNLRHNLRETACCLWEHALTLLMENDGALCRYTNRIGTAELRSKVAALAESVDKAWTIAYKRFDYDQPFDWEFVPDLLNEFWGDDPAHAQDDAFAWCKALSEILGKDEQLVRMLWQEEYGEDLGE